MWAEVISGSAALCTVPCLLMAAGNTDRAGSCLVPEHGCFCLQEQMGVSWMHVVPHVALVSIKSGKRRRNELSLVGNPELVSGIFSQCLMAVCDEARDRLGFVSQLVLT